MKINWNFSITLRWIHIPVLPIISLTEIKPEVVVQTIPAPEPEILPIPAKRKARTKTNDEDIKSINVNPELRYLRRLGPLRGTEVYRTHHARKDIIQWFLERKNRPLTVKQIQSMKKSPFNHKWEKCNPECNHKLISYGTLIRLLNNHITDKQIREGTPQVIIFEYINRRKGYRLTKDFYKSAYGRNALIDQWQPPTPQAQIPAETNTIANWVKENSEIRR